MPHTRLFQKEEYIKVIKRGTVWVHHLDNQKKKTKHVSDSSVRNEKNGSKIENTHVKNYCQLSKTSLGGGKIIYTTKEKKLRYTKL
jgi:hypothetical protein